MTDTCVICGQVIPEGRMVCPTCEAEPPKPSRTKLVYIAHPFQGKQENIDKVQKIILKLLKRYPNVTYYSPLHATGFFYFDVSYSEGMEHCFEALSRCDELWLCGDWRESRGCNMEYGYAKAKGIPIKFIGLMPEGD